MSSNRYRGQKTFNNSSETYEKVLDDKGLKFIRQYSTPTIQGLTKKQRARINTTDHIWKLGDKYYKLAAKYYGDQNYWWVIAQFNFAPTEAHLTPGMVLKIPTSLEQITRYYR
tara:strand:- start:893 stop:1231 length:339 start_codon:yes stop_codon:yes gene_type:complete